MQLSDDQKTVIRELFSWLATNNRPQYITVGGFAGTGKTTLISILRKHVHKQNKKINVAFCAYTGKAARVLKQKLQESAAVFPDDTVGTIHSLIYSPITNDDQEITGWKRRDELKTDLIIVDEASMVDEEIWQDLLDFKLPIIAVGDHGQLPPIKGNFNLMQSPQLTLTQIHRQAQDNPIIKLSIMARTEGKIPALKYSPTVRKLAKDGLDTQEFIGDILNNYKSDTLILCGYNNTRVRLNQHIRNAKEIFEPTPQQKDRVICLRNNHEKQIYNGMLGEIVKVEKTDDEDWVKAEVAMDDEVDTYKGKLYLPQFNLTEAANFTSKRSLTMNGDLFDYGYAMTVHKAQGSQSKKVVLFEERFSRMSDEDWRRWLYTAVTRAEEELYIVGSSD